MKISFCSIAFRKSCLPLTQIIELASLLGYDGVEVWVNHLNKDLSDVETLKEALKKSKVEIPMISPYFNLTGTKKQLVQTFKEAETIFKYAKALNAPLIRIFTGVVGSQEITRDKYQQAVSALKQLSELACVYGVKLALETHPKTLVDSVPATLKLLNQLQDQSNIGLNLDIYHMWEVHQDPVDVLNQLFPFVFHIHAKNACLAKNNHYPLFHDKQGLQEINGVTSLNNGSMPYLPFLQRLKQLNYQHYLSVEWFGQPILEGLIKDRQAVVSVFQL